MRCRPFFILHSAFCIRPEVALGDPFWLSTRFGVDWDGDMDIAQGTERNGFKQSFGWGGAGPRCRHVGLSWRIGQVSAGTTAPRIILRRDARGLPDLAAESAPQTGQKNMTISFPLRDALPVRRGRSQTRPVQGQTVLERAQTTPAIQVCQQAAPLAGPNRPACGSCP